MEKDFHFYCIAVLARAAGFHSGDALRIAYASQYVDDSTESEPIEIEIEGKNFKFDPVMTSYEILDKENLDWSAQKRVWLPFHFLPPKPLNPEKPEIPFSYRTCKDSEFGRLLLREASRRNKNKLELLVSIGIALHTYADSWAHDGFSGRIDKENDIRFKSLACLNPTTNEWRSEPIAEAVFNLSPQIGHGQCGHYPDIPYLNWKYNQNGEKRNRSNREQFLEASEKIHAYLVKVRNQFEEYPLDPIPTQGSKTSLTWEELNTFIQPILGYTNKNLKERCDKWRGSFSRWFRTRYNDFWMEEDPVMERVHSISFHYDIQDCRSDVFIGNVDWKSYKDYKGHKFALKRKNDLVEFLDSFWVHFHRAALRQRHFVLENIP